MNRNRDNAPPGWRCGLHTATVAATFWLLCASSATAQNLIVNGDFSTGDLSGWTIQPGGVAQTTITYDDAMGNPAGSALLDRVSSTQADNSDYLYQVVPVTPGKQYKLDADWKGDLYNGGTGRNWAEVMVAFVSDPGSPQFQIMYKKASDGGPHQPPTTGSDWESVLLSPDGGPADGIFTASDNYMVVCFNLGGRAVTSNNTQPAYYWVDNVNVTPWPPISTPVITNVVRQGSDIILQGTDGPPKGAYQVLRSTDVTQPPGNWLDAGADIFDADGDFSFTNGLPEDSAGFYRLLVLSLVGAPEITQQPQDRTAVVGQPASFSVTAEGAPPLHYQWYYNTNIVLTDETNTTLTLNNVQLSDAGRYSVTITNQFGATNSAFAELTVTTNHTVAIPDGYATQNGGTTGGGNATPVTVSTASAFRSAVNNNTPAVVIVQGRIDLGGEVSIGSNKTIMGADTSAGLFGGTVKVQGANYIFQNLTFGPASGDVMEISGAENVFVTKCEFYGSTDELCSIVRQADYVTISWCKFYFPNPDSHSFAHLIGNGDNVTADRGKLHVTLHHNWYAEGVRGRMPRVRFGHVHIYNNYYNSVGNGYCIGIGVECHIRVENTHFESVNDAWEDYGGTSNGEIGWAGLKFVNSSQPTFMPNAFPVFTPPYAYTLDPVDDVKAIVTAGAGNVNGQ